MGIDNNSENSDFEVKECKSQSVKENSTMRKKMKCNSKRKSNELEDPQIDGSKKTRKKNKILIDPTDSKEEVLTKSSGNHDTMENQNEEDDVTIVQKPKKFSNRQIKKEKAQKRIDEQRNANKLEAMQKALTYVSKWKHAKNEWKFEKLKQVWLMDNLFDKDFIPDEKFPMVLEYFEGCKGMAREKLCQKAMNIIKSIEDNEKEKNELIDSIEYQRARELMQIISLET